MPIAKGIACASRSSFRLRKAVVAVSKHHEEMGTKPHGARSTPAGLDTARLCCWRPNRTRPRSCIHGSARRIFATVSSELSTHVTAWPISEQTAGASDSSAFQSYKQIYTFHVESRSHRRRRCQHDLCGIKVLTFSQVDFHCSTTHDGVVETHQGKRHEVTQLEPADAAGP